MLVLRGTVVTMRPGGAVLDQGEVYAGDDGLIAAVTPEDPVPAGFQDAPRVAAGGLIYPGLIDLHNHLLYNSLPLWTEPSRTTPWESHNEWVQDDDAPTYRTKVSAPARLLGAAAGRALLRYVETRALVGGTTCIQGNPRGATPPDGELVRNIDTERLGTDEDFIRVRTIVATRLKDLDDIVTAVVEDHRGFICHAAEGTLPDLRNEFALLDQAKLVRRELMAIHGSALTGPDFKLLADGDASLVWSPFSNLWLYGATADVGAAKAAGVRLCLGSDWAPSGTRNVLWELKVADLWNQAQPTPVFTDQELVGLVTANPGQALAGVWPHPVGRVEAGALADLVVVARRHPDPYRNLIAATETDVRVVVVGGQARFGTSSLLATAGAATATPLRAGRLRRAVDYGDAGVTWAKVLAELEQVRANPQQAADRAADALAAFAIAGPATRGAAPFVLLPDMPAPETDGTRAGPLAAPAPVTVPALQPITASRAWFDAVDANPFHGGLLSGLRSYA